MAEPTINLGGGNWAGKSDNLLGYYKEGERFYKQDFTFSRSTTGTYTDSDGYIQEMPYNLLQQSNQFDTTWTLSAGIDLTSGQSGYDGTNNAWLLKRNTTGARYVQQSLTRPSGQYSFSVYLKAESTDWSYIWAYDGSTTVNAYFDLNNGVVGNTSGLDSTNVVSVGNDWYRCTITFTQAITSVRIYPAYANGSISTGTDNGIYIQDAQLVKGTSAKTYFPTTTRLNMPRVDYLNNSNGSLILEPQRTNNFPNSSDFSIFTVASAGTGTNPTITSNYSISPDGNQNADRIIFDRGTGTTGGDTSYITYNLSLGTIDSTLSIYLKTNDETTKDVTLRLGAALFDYDVTVTSQWQRFTLNGNTNVDRVQILLYGNQNSQTADLSCYGLQIEQGSYPTTLINTSGSSVTRNADACELTNVADRIGQTEGTLYGEFDFKDHSTGTRRLLCLTDGTSTNRITTYVNTLDKLSVYIVNGGAAQADIQATILTEGIIKYAVAYANNSIKLYLNGTQVGTDTSATIPSTSDFLVGFEHSGSSSYFNWRNCQLYSTALTDSELATLTTL